MIIRFLVRLGLSENEAKVYLGFLKYPDVTAADVARELDMDKSSCYRAVVNLLTLGLVVTRPKNRGTTYTAVNPNQLTLLLDKKRTELDIQALALDSYITSLAQSIPAKNTIGTRVKMERGLEGLQSMMEDRLKFGGSTQLERWFSDHPLILTPDWSRYIKDYAKRRISLNISVKGLYDTQASTSNYGELMRSSAKILKEVRILPQGIDNKQAFVIYADKVAFVTPDRDDLVVLTIQEPILVNLLSDMFYFIWERSERI